MIWFTHFRVLGFHRAPPVAGRFVNVGQLEQLANKGLKKTFFTSPSKCNNVGILAR